MSKYHGWTFSNHIAKYSWTVIWQGAYYKLDVGMLLGINYDEEYIEKMIRESSWKPDKKTRLKQFYEQVQKG
jgi:hypothetical protein